MAVSRIISVRLPEHVYKAVQEFKKKGGNISALVTQKLEEHFFGPQIDKADDKALYQIIQLEKELQELKREREEQDKKIAELERKLTILMQAYERKKQAEEEEERKKEEGDYIQLIEEVYGDMLREGVETWIHRNIAGVRAIKVRYEKVLPKTAKELGIKLDYSKLRAVLIENYPELAKYLFGKEVVIYERSNI
jgi:DNA repair exonuclease SbcCD ATPase subunit